MNRRMIAYLLGRILLVEGLLMIPSALIALLYGEGDFSAFCVSAGILLAIGVLAGVRKPRNRDIYIQEGFFTVAAAWVLLSLFGALPFLLSGAVPSFWDCLFETVSGFTTTGASILPNVEALPHGLLFWRSFTHWVGGMGVLVFVLAVLPMSDDRSMVLMRAEVPGPVASKLVPRMRDTAKILYLVYSVMTVILIVLLLFGGMPLFDAVCHAFGAAGTGGFGIKATSIAYYNSAYIDVVLAVFMLLFGVNFNLYYLILIKRARDVLRSEELRCYLLIAFSAVLVIALDIRGLYQNFSESLRYSFFQVSSIMTTTGYATADFANNWPAFSQMTLVMLMLIGASAGSTGGGLKVSRLVICVKSFVSEIRHMLHPRLISTVRLDGRPVDKQTLTNTRIYVIAYVLVMLLTTLIVSLDEFDFTTTVTAVVACFNNIGPGLSLVGPTGNFSMFSPLSKVVLSLAMLFGRLEIFPMLVLFTPSIWGRKAA